MSYNPGFQPDKKYGKIACIIDNIEEKREKPWLYIKVQATNYIYFSYDF